MARGGLISSDPNFLLRYLDALPSDEDSDGDFDGYLPSDSSEPDVSSYYVHNIVI